MTAVIAAAGSGERLGAGGPKAFVPLAGRPMIAWSLDACLACGSVAGVVVAVPGGHEHGLDGLERVVTVEGGSTRAESVAKVLAEVRTEYVAIHDAARPLLTPELLDALVSALAAAPDAAGIIAAAPVTDTVKKVRVEFPLDSNGNSTRVSETLDRKELWGAQTPQVFRRDWLVEAYAPRAEHGKSATDDTQLVEAIGHPCAIVPSSSHNLKITTQDVLTMARAVLDLREKARPTACGHPYADEQAMWSNLPRLKPSDLFGG